MMVENRDMKWMNRKQWRKKYQAIIRFHGKWYKWLGYQLTFISVSKLFWTDLKKLLFWKDNIGYSEMPLFFDRELCFFLISFWGLCLIICWTTNNASFGSEIIIIICKHDLWNTRYSRLRENRTNLNCRPTIAHFALNRNGWRRIKVWIIIIIIKPQWKWNKLLEFLCKQLNKYVPQKHTQIT